MAAERPRKSVEIDAFFGMVNNINTSDLPPGYAIVQSNVTCVVEAELNTRGGYRTVTFEN